MKQLKIKVDGEVLDVTLIKWLHPNSELGEVYIEFCENWNLVGQSYLTMEQFNSIIVE